MKHSHHSLMITRSGYIYNLTSFWWSEPALELALNLDILTLPIDNHSTRKSIEKGWIQSESLSTTSEWTRGKNWDFCFFFFVPALKKIVAEHCNPEYWSFIHVPLYPSPASSSWTLCLPRAWLLDSLKRSCSLSWKSSASLTSALTGKTLLQHLDKVARNVFVFTRLCARVCVCSGFVSGKRRGRTQARCF